MPCVNVTTINHHSQIIFLTEDQLHKLALEPGDPVRVKAGSASTDAMIIPHPDKNQVSSKVLESLDLPPLQEITIQANGSNLFVGPLIGIMVSRSKKRSLPPFTSQNNLLLGFMNYVLKAKYLGYVFHPGAVDMVNRKITGFYLETAPEGKKIWKKHAFPLPDIIYDRILFRSTERKKLTREVTAFFAQNKVPYFNPKFLNKWETYRFLVTNPKLHAHLPDTRKCDSPDSLLKFLEIYPTIYLKPTNGSLGKDIIKIIRTPQGYHFQYRKKQRPVTGIWQTPQELSSELEKLMKSKYYIMQQGLDLIKYHGRIFDIRVLMQKNGQGEWINTATVARVAPSGSIFPNIAAGGEPKNVETLWRDLTSTDWSLSPTCAKTIEISLASAETLENCLGTFGEVGLDMGIDNNGNVWIIEINSKPSRKVFPPDQPQLKKNSIELPIDYAAYLAGFAPDQRWDNN